MQILTTSYLILFRENKIKVDLECQRKLLHESKLQRREAVAKEVRRRKEVEREVDDLNQWLEEMADEVQDYRSETRAALVDKSKAEAATNKLRQQSRNRLTMLKELKTKLDQAKDDLADESQRRVTLERIYTIRTQIKRHREVGRRGGSGKWPVHVVLLICELLVAGTPPASIPAVIQTSQAAVTGDGVTEAPPSVNFVRECRVVVQNLNEMLAAMRLGDADTWHQLFTDGTTRRQTEFQNLIIGLMEEEKLNPVIVSSCMWLEDGTSENQVQSVLDMVRSNCYQ